MAASVTVLDRSASVAAALPPLRQRMLELLADPQSATSLSRELDVSRQKLNYHLRELERHGLVVLVDERPRRGLTERFYQATGERLLIDPELIVVSDRPAPNDRYAAERLAAVAARAVHDIGALMAEATDAGQRLATFTLESHVTFATPSDMRGFVAELAELVARYDRPHVPDGRRHRFLAMSHPSRQESTDA